MDVSSPRAALAAALLAALCACVLLQVAAAAPQDYKDDEGGMELAGGLNEVMSKEQALSLIEKKLREDIEREAEDLMVLERQLKGNLFKLQSKKRQLEIRKRTPVQCLVNIVSCWRRK